MKRHQKFVELKEGYKQRIKRLELSVESDYPCCYDSNLLFRAPGSGKVHLFELLLLLTCLM